MINALLAILVKLLLALRYRVRVRGLAEVARRGTGGILFLPNHPGLIDPVILVSQLHARFRPRALADRDRIDRPLIRWLTRRVGVIPIPDIKAHGTAVEDEVRAARGTCADTLRTDGTLLFYPSGHIYRTRFESLRGNSGVEDLLQKVPDARVVMIRTRGLWGSSFTLADGEYPRIPQLLKRHAWTLAANLLLFTPRRDVTIELREPADFPRGAGRHELNAFLEAYYNEDAPPNTHVAYRWWQRPRRQTRPEPQWGRAAGDLATVPANTRRLVEARLREISGVREIRDEQRLAEDLGLDSLSRAELSVWLSREFGAAPQDGDALTNVGDVLLAACGEAIVTRPMELKPPPPGWFRGPAGQRIRVAGGANIAEIFLDSAARQPGRIIVADAVSGARSYRELITAILVLKPRIEALEGDHVGVLLPASVGATTLYWACVFAGKVPLMVNWTTGTRNMAHTLELAGVRHVLTSSALVTRLAARGTDLDGIRDRLVMLEDLAGAVGKGEKLAAFLRARLSWRALRRAPIARHAVVLVTSGSENLPKAVPLTHENLITNARDVADVVPLMTSDRMLGFLPPFHSFGLTVTLVLPTMVGLPVVYHANPTEALTLVRLVAAYRASIVLGTPTFLNGLLRAAGSDAQLASLRIIVTGAEKCPERLYAEFARRCPSATVLEGYGITECSPIVSANRMETTRAGTVGKVMPSVQHVLLNVETGTPVQAGETGMLLVRGPSIFEGYLGEDAESPFVEHGGRRWYRTGDLLSEDAEGILTFRGRLKRFVKVGGEMVSLPAIEAALASQLSKDDDDGPALAVTAVEEHGRPEIVLFSTRPVERQEANAHIRGAGLSPLHNIGRVVEVDAIPQLGNGKVDYRALAALL